MTTTTTTTTMIIIMYARLCWRTRSVRFACVRGAHDAYYHIQSDAETGAVWKPFFLAFLHTRLAAAAARRPLDTECMPVVSVCVHYTISVYAMHRVEPCPPRVSPKMVNTTRASASDLTRTLHTYYTHAHTHTHTHTIRALLQT